MSKIQGSQDPPLQINVNKRKKVLAFGSGEQAGVGVGTGEGREPSWGWPETTCRKSLRAATVGFGVPRLYLPPTPHPTSGATWRELRNQTQQPKPTHPVLAAKAGKKDLPRASRARTQERPVREKGNHGRAAGACGDPGWSRGACPRPSGCLCGFGVQDALAAPPAASHL